MDNSLTFNHRIPVEVFTEAESIHVTLLVNGEVCHEKNYAGGSGHKEVIEFHKQYEDAAKNTMTWKISGDREVEKKHLRVCNISINGQAIDVNNSEYFPDIDKVWWQSLGDDERTRYEDVIHGNVGNTFGWYGEVNYYYCTGLDLRSRFEYNKNNRDPEMLLHKSNAWVFANQDSAKAHNKIDR